ncbi:MAG: transporter [Deltaproteobacteria bacterium]|nr:transporter [Deltaproteobacteria bacterium]
MVLLGGTVRAEDVPTDRFANALVTDRPDAAEASVTVGRHRFQVETSFAFGRDDDAGTMTKTYGFPTLLRFGVSDPLELRMEGELYSIQSQTGTGTARGFQDLAVGMKAHVVENRGWIPSFGTLTHVSLPTGNDVFSSNSVEPSAKLLADWELPADFSLGANAGIDLPARDAAGDKFARFLYAAALNHPTPFLKDRMRVFVEAAGAVPLKKGKAGEHTFDSGLAFLVTPNLQLDGFAQIGLTDAAPGLQAGMGVCWRY